jgi:hypothetical protein
MARDISRFNPPAARSPDSRRQLGFIGAAAARCPDVVIAAIAGKSLRIFHASASHHPADEFDRMVGRLDLRNLHCRRAIDHTRPVRQDLQT